MDNVLRFRIHLHESDSVMTNHNIYKQQITKNHEVKKMAHYLISMNQDVGSIEVPKNMVDDMGWDRIKKEVMESFELMAHFQFNLKIAWNLAINNVFSAWHGAKDLMDKIK